MSYRRSDIPLPTSSIARACRQIVLLALVAVFPGLVAAGETATSGAMVHSEEGALPSKAANASEAAQSGEHNPPVYNITMPAMLVESIPVRGSDQGMSAHRRPDQIALGFRLQMAGASQGQMPFWIYSNRHGELYPFTANAAMHLFGGWHRQYRSGITLSTGADIMLRGANDASLRFQEAYVQVGYGSFVLWAGRKREHFGFVHPELSTGTADVSLNARPITKITLATNGFQAVPGTRGIVDYHASFAHGWLRKEDHLFLERPFLHQKHLYLRLFNDRSPVVPQGGLKHFAQWGGLNPQFGRAPAGFSAFRDIFLARSADSSEILPGGQLGNQFQNHVGTYDFSLLIRLERVSFAVSRQFFLEDTPNARFGTPWDGMWGAWVTFSDGSRSGRDPSRIGHNTSQDSRNAFPPRPPDRRFSIRSLNYEHINTKEGVDRISHRDFSTYYNYHNHWFYLGGWTNDGRAIGNPLFFGDSGHIGVVNNIMLAHHLGVAGYAGPADWRFFTTYSRNYGSPRVVDHSGRRYDGVTERQDQWSFMLELRDRGLISNLMRSFGRGLPDPLQDLEVIATLALDLGEAHPRNAGMMLGLRWATW